MELQHEGLLELRHGSGAYISAPRSAKARSAKLLKAQTRVRDIVEDLRNDFSAEEIRRLFEAQLIHTTATQRKS
jgi:GntR family transcriptional regulator